MSNNRRDFLKTIGAAGVSIGGMSEVAWAAPENILSDDRMGILVDTTMCIGCRRCEFACRQSHDLPSGSMEDYDDRSVFESYRRPHNASYTVVNEFDNPRNEDLPVHAKIQCMHCDYPACVSACVVGAFSKQENGTVLWDAGKCIGCRYCMIACPFEIPTFDYDKALEPEIRKCDLCYSRTSEGKLPACLEICPMEVMKYGKRHELLELAHKRIYDRPEAYVDHVFGEQEVGGTSWLYLAGIGFSEMNFPDLGQDPAPGASESLQHAIFKYFIPPASLFALLGAIMWTGKRKLEAEQEVR